MTVLVRETTTVIYFAPPPPMLRPFSSIAHHKHLSSHLTLTSPPPPPPPFFFFFFPAHALSRKASVAVPYQLALQAAGVVLHGPSILRDAFVGEREYLLRVWPDNRRILWWFAHRGACQNASLNAVPPAGCPAGGLGPWEDTLQGAAAGLFLQGAGSLLRFEDHAGLRQQMDALVSAIESFQEADGYAMAFARNDSYRRENPNYVTAWLTHGMLEAHIAGNPAALPLIRRHLNWFNNHSFLPLMLPTLGGPASLDPSKPTPDGFPAGTGAEDAAGYGGGFRGDGCSLGGVTNSQPPGFCINHHLLYLSYQGMIKHTRMALTPLGTAADVRTALLYAEDWWLDRLAGGA